MAIVIKPNNPLIIEGLSVFLAGSIEMGVAEEWQKNIEDTLSGFNITLLNPRRDDWDSSWEQRADNPTFRNQVKWEMDALGIADLIFMYFQPGTSSPISLLELGLYAERGNVVVCCPEGFWRKGNVDIVCERHAIPVFSNLELATKWLVDYVVKES